MTGQRAHSYRSYRYSGRDTLRNPMKGCRHGVGSIKLDYIAWQAIVHSLTDADFLHSALAQHEQGLHGDGDKKPASAEEITAKIDRLRLKDKAILGAITNPDLSDSRLEFKPRHREVMEQVRKLEGDLELIHRASGPNIPKRKSKMPSAGRIDEMAGLLRGGLAGMTRPADRQALLQRIMTQCVLDGKLLKMQCLVGPKVDISPRCETRRNKAHLRQ